MLYFFMDSLKLLVGIGFKHVKLKSPTKMTCVVLGIFVVSVQMKCGKEPNGEGAGDTDICYCYEDIANE